MIEKGHTLLLEATNENNDESVISNHNKKSSMNNSQDFL